MTTPFKTSVSDDVKQAQAAMQARLNQRRDPATGVLTAAQPATGVAPGFKAEDYTPRQAVKCWVWECKLPATDDVVYGPSEDTVKPPEVPIPGLDSADAFEAYHAWQRVNRNAPVGVRVNAPFETRLCGAHLAHWLSARTSFWNGKFDTPRQAWEYAARCPASMEAEPVWLPPKRHDIPLQHLEGPNLKFRVIDPTQGLLLIWDEVGNTSVEMAPRLQNFAEARGWTVSPA